MKRYIENGTAKNKAIIIDMLIVLTLCIAFFGSIYTVNEGHVGIVKRFSEAQSQVSPGLHFKVPLIDSVEELEVRTRKNEEKMASSTKEQMPVTVIVSVNWTVEKTAALEYISNMAAYLNLNNVFLILALDQLPKALFLNLQLNN